MRTPQMFFSLLVLASLAGCGGHGDDKLADRVEKRADKNAGILEDRADVLDARAKQLREKGEQRADAIDAADVNADVMSGAQKDAIVASEAPAVP